MPKKSKKSLIKFQISNFKFNFSKKLPNILNRKNYEIAPTTEMKNLMIDGENERIQGQEWRG